MPKNGRADRHHLLPDLKVRDLRSDLDDLTGRLIADDMRLGGQGAAPAVEHVAALDAHRLDLDDDPVRRALRVGDRLVAQHARVAVLPDHRRFHSEPPCRAILRLADIKAERGRGVH